MGTSSIGSRRRSRQVAAHLSGVAPVTKPRRKGVVTCPVCLTRGRSRDSICLVNLGTLVGIVLSALPMALAQLATPAPSSLAAEQSAAVVRSRTIGPSDNLAQALESLRPGGVTELRLRPGTYEVFERDVAVHAGTPEDRITVIAADPDDPPVVSGSLVLQNPSHWTIDRLVFQGVHSGYEALRMNGGTGWMILRSEFFGEQGYSAQALLNVAAYKDTAPRAFRVAYSCFHDGPTDPPSVHDHLIYVTSSAHPTPSYISRNILYDNVNGSAIKANSSNVRINYNTMQDVAGAVTVQENQGAAGGLRGVTTERDLIRPSGRSRAPTTPRCSGRACWT